MLVVLPRHAGDEISHSKTQTTDSRLRITIVVTDCLYAVRIMRIDAFLRSHAAAETHKCPWRGLIDDYGGRMSAMDASPSQDMSIRLCRDVVCTTDT